MEFKTLGFLAGIPLKDSYPLYITKEKQPVFFKFYSRTPPVLCDFYMMFEPITIDPPCHFAREKDGSRV